MFGFDVLVDQQQRPHLLEVNFAPSLNTDSDLDLEVKSKVVADLLTLAGIRGPPGLQRPPSQGADANVIITGCSSAALEEKYGPESSDATGDDGGDGGGRNKDDNAQSGAGGRPVADGGDCPVAPRKSKIPTGGKVPGRASGKRERQGGERVGAGTEGEIGMVDPADHAGRPKTKWGERRRPVGRPGSRQGNAGDRSGGDGGRVGGDRAAPAWEGSFRGGEGASLSADEVSAMYSSTGRASP